MEIKEGIDIITLMFDETDSDSLKLFVSAKIQEIKSLWNILK